MNEPLPHPTYPNIAVTASGVIYRDGREVRVSNRTRYPNVCARRADGTFAAVGVHVLVCETFHGLRPDPAMQVAHNNGDRYDNRASNLRWATGKENWADRRRHGTETIGSRHGRAKLTEEQVSEIRSRVASLARGDITALAREYGVSHGVMRRIVHGQSWAHVA